VSGLALGQHLRIRGRSNPAGVQAGELELRSTQSDSRVILQGPISAFTGFGVTILGVAADLGTVSDSNFTRSVGQSSGSTALGRATFFAALKVGTVVKLRGDRTGSSIRWTEAEIEED
jgi:hypothetical protein